MLHTHSQSHGPAYTVCCPRGKLPCATGRGRYAQPVRTVRWPRDVRVSIGLHSVGHRCKVVGQKLGRVVRLRSEQCLEAVRVELVHALARNVRRHPLVGDEPARRRLNPEGHHCLRRGLARLDRGNRFLNLREVGP